MGGSNQKDAARRRPKTLEPQVEGLSVGFECSGFEPRNIERKSQNRAFYSVVRPSVVHDFRTFDWPKAEEIRRIMQLT